MKYEWRPVVGYEGIYEVRPGSDGGRVRRVSSIQRSYIGWELYGITNDGYPRVVLSKLGQKPKHYFLHTLILNAWVGPCPSKCEALHRDDIRINNTLENLHWGTRSSNLKDMVKNKRHGKFTKPDYAKRGWETRRKNGPSKQMIMIEFQGKTQCISDWAREVGMSGSCMRSRLRKWPLKEALTKPKTK